MKIDVNQPTNAALHIMATELDTNMQRLEQAQSIPANLRAKRIHLLQQISEFKLSALALTRDSLEIEKARIFMAVQDAVDDKTGKPKYSNEAARSAAMAITMRDDPDYQEALSAYRAAEKHLEAMNIAVQEVEEEIKTAAEQVWTARTLVEGSVTALQAITAFDGPKLPSEISLKVPEIRLTAPESMPPITLVPKGVAA